jgi:AhpD family alkylhydroperoxidase
MKKRINIKQVTPAAHKAMMSLENYIRASDIKPSYRELIKIRASQINGCAYCVDAHTKDARKLGESERKIYAISAWKESPLFNEEERVILALTDEMANISVQGVSEDTYEDLTKYFDDKTISDLMMINITINAWNRWAVGTHLQFEN